MNIIHGKRYHPIYTAWRHMRARCGIIKGASKQDIENYQGRGITVCEEWNDFTIFYKWAANKWAEGLTIDRKNNNGNYEPDNCRFVTNKKNCQNSSQSKRWHIKGRIFKSSRDAAKTIGITRSTVQNWCRGQKCGKYKYPPKRGCFVTSLY